MIKHAIVYDDNKNILVVIMPVYVIEAAYLHHFGCDDESSKTLPQKSAKSTRDMMMEPHMTEFVFLCRLHFFGFQSM